MGGSVSGIEEVLNLFSINFKIKEAVSSSDVRI